MEPFYPLRAYVCERCWLVQLEQFESSEEIFSDYAYFSSYSTSWLEHSRRYVDAMVAQLGLGESSLAVEIASNDGYLLQYFGAHGVPVLGIEPAANVAARAIEQGIPTRVEFFGVATATALREESGADLLLGNNVLAHVPDLNDFVGGMKVLLGDRGTITMEFPHLLALIDERQWDTIYHEHFSYFSWLTVRKIFAAHGLRLFDVEELPTHGGSLRIFGCHDDDPREETERARELAERERAAGLERIETYTAFRARLLLRTSLDILTFLIGLRREGLRIAGYGAPAKVPSTMPNFCGVGWSSSSSPATSTPQAGPPAARVADPDPRSADAARRAPGRRPDPAVEPARGDRRAARIRPRVGRTLRGPRARAEDARVILHAERTSFPSVRRWNSGSACPTSVKRFAPDLRRREVR